MNYKCHRCKDKGKLYSQGVMVVCDCQYEGPKFDENGHPDDVTLGTISRWDHDDWPGLLDFIRDVWNHTYGTIKQYEDKVCFVTGGWSANEQIIMALEDNIVIKALYWRSSHSGGEYWYAL